MKKTYLALFAFGLLGFALLTAFSSGQELTQEEKEQLTKMRFRSISAARGTEQTQVAWI